MDLLEELDRRIAEASRKICMSDRCVERCTRAVMWLAEYAMKKRNIAELAKRTARDADRICARICKDKDCVAIIEVIMQVYAFGSLLEEILNIFYPGF